MPIYSYKCDKCQKVEDKFNKMADHKNGPECCGKAMQQYYGNYHVVKDFEPYWDENLGDNPVYVKSKKHRKKLLRENNLVELYGKGWV